MKKYLPWVCISCLLNGCVLHETKDTVRISEESVFVPEMIEQVIQNEEEFNFIEIQGILKESFVQSTNNQDLVYHNIQGERVDAGPVFLDYRCTKESDNLILYGHSSRSSSILFTPLVQYLDESFAKAHQELRFNIEGEEIYYELMSVFLFPIYEASDNDWMQVDFQKDYLFEKAKERLKERSVIELDDVQGDQLLTLVTCNPDNHDERVIVIGIKKAL